MGASDRRREASPRLFVAISIAAAVLGLVSIWTAATPFSRAPAVDTDALYEVDPLRLIAGYNLTTHYTLDEDLWDVWICEVAEGNLDISPEKVASLLESEIVPYFDWLSGGRYRPVFRMGGTVKTTSFDNRGSCYLPVWEASGSAVPEDRAEGAMLIVNKPSYGSIGSLGAISHVSRIEVELRAFTFPDNTRFLYLDGRAVAEPGSLPSPPVEGATLPKLSTVAHELGHAIGFPHSYRFVRYDNPMDIMGDNDPVSGLRIGTIAINRYAVGWMDPAEVAIHSGGETSRYTLSPLGDKGIQMLVLKSDQSGFMTLGARVRKGYDSGLLKEGVESYLIEQQPPSCFHYPGYKACVGTARPTQALIADLTPSIDGEDPLAHVMGIGDGYTWGDLTVTVLERIGDDFVVEVRDVRPTADPAVTTPPSGEKPAKVDGNQFTDDIREYPQEAH